MLPLSLLPLRLLCLLGCEVFEVCALAGGCTANCCGLFGVLIATSYVGNDPKWLPGGVTMGVRTAVLYEGVRASASMSYSPSGLSTSSCCRSSGLAECSRADLDFDGMSRGRTQLVGYDLSVAANLVVLDV